MTPTVSHVLGCSWSMTGKILVASMLCGIGGCSGVANPAGDSSVAVDAIAGADLNPGAEVYDASGDDSDAGDGGDDGGILAPPDAAERLDAAQNDLASVGGSDGGGSDGGDIVWHFTSIADKAGINFHHYPANGQGAVSLYDHGCGLAAGDFNGDGHEDLLALSQCGPSGYFLGNGDGTFVDASDRLKTLNDGIRIAVSYGDYDNDGRIDFYITFSGRPNALLHQNQDGSFTDVAAALGVAANGHYSGTTFVDVNGDGYLDLVVAGNLIYTTNEIIPGGPMCPVSGIHRALGPNDLFNQPGPSEPSLLFINSGPGGGFHFTNEAAARGIPLGGMGFDRRGYSDVTVTDYDRDGAVDLLLSEMFLGKTTLLKNDGSGHFTDVTAAMIPRASYGSASTAVADFDNDGYPDVYMSDMHSDMWVVPGMDFSKIVPNVRYKTPGGPMFGVGDSPMGPLFGNSFWLSHGGASFTESEGTWQTETFQPWGILAGDFDNDGDLDVLISSGMSNPFDFWPNAFLQNTGSHFVHREGDLGFDPPPEGRFDPAVRVNGQPRVSAARNSVTADFDEDGDLDIAVLVWNNRLDLLRNDSPPGRHWIDVRPRGKVLRDPYGVWVEVKAGGRVWARAMDASRGYLSQSTQWVHFGLGAQASIDQVTVKWSNGTATTVANPAVDHRLIVSQP